MIYSDIYSDIGRTRNSKMDQSIPDNSSPRYIQLQVLSVFLQNLITTKIELGDQPAFIHSSMRPIESDHFINQLIK